MGASQEREVFSINQKNINKLTALGMMCAMVFVSNYLRVTMPIAIGGRTSFTLANIMCCLSGLLLGPVGGLASGLGSALYDLTNPAYAAECWITFITKGIMGMVAGFAMRDRATPMYGRCTAAAALGCLAYYILYFFKSFAYDGLLLGGLTAATAAAALVLKIPASIFNAAVAILLSPPLCIALRKALHQANIQMP
ncbi:ECF transporter S component [Oscillibacter valericigenes]|nr:ECF transporter S component [Oscillibacter valericigenes]